MKIKLHISALNKGFLILLLMVAVPQMSFAKRKPSWVKQRPDDPAYYTGIAMSHKTKDSREYVRTTRAMALKQMSSEIKVKVSSNSVLRQLEDLGRFSEQYEAEIRTSVEQTLEGYEVKTWENRKEYWVMVRLSKEKYRRMKLMELDRAKSHAYSYYMDAKKAINEDHDVFTALNYLSKAVISIKDHLEEDLTYRSIDGTINVGTETYGFIQDIFHRVELTPVQKKYLISLSRNEQTPIEVKAKLYTENGESIPLQGLPLNFEFSKGEGILTSYSVTGYDGIAKVVISRLTSKRKDQALKCTLDLSGIKKEAKDEESLKVLEMFFPEKLIPATYIGLELKKSSAYLETKEMIFGSLSDQEPFINMVKTVLNKSFFTFTGLKEDADYIVKIKSDFRKGEEKKGNGYSLFIVFADFSISVVDAETHEEVFSDSINGIRGIRPGSYDYALKDAEKNALDAFKQKIISRMEQLEM